MRKVADGSDLHRQNYRDGKISNKFAQSLLNNWVLNEDLPI